MTLNEARPYLNSKVVITTKKNAKYIGIPTGLRSTNHGEKVHIDGLIICHKDGVFKAAPKRLENRKRWFKLGSLKQMELYTDMKEYQPNQGIWRRSIMFAHKHPDGTFSDFFNNELGVKFCGNAHLPIVKVMIVPCEGKGYWAWWSNLDLDFSMIFRMKLMVETCFQYGYKKEEEAGLGELLEVNVLEMDP